MDCPLHRVVVAGFTVTTGCAVTDTVTLVVFVHPLPSVPVIRYVVVEAGLADTLVPVVPDKPVEGLHMYVLPPDAVKVTDAPLHIDGDKGLAVIVGSGFTVTVTPEVLLQPLPSVPVTI